MSNKLVFKNRFIVLLDIILSFFAYIIAVLTVFPTTLFIEVISKTAIFYGVTVALFILARLVANMYRISWAQISVRDLIRYIIIDCIIAVISVIIALILFKDATYFKYALVLNFLIIFCCLVIRFTIFAMSKILGEHYIKNGKRVIVIGAGNLGVMLVRDLQHNKSFNYDVVGFVDDNSLIQKNIIYGKKVLGKIEDLKRVCIENKIEEIIFAIHSISRADKERIIEECSKTNLKVKVIPGLESAISQGKIDTNSIRDIQIEDLLEREPIVLDNSAISNDLSGKVVLVTGGGGSIGSELCRQIIKYSPENLIIFDIYENTTYSLQLELEEKYPDRKITVLIGSIRDKQRLEDVFERYKPQYVFNAAAHKHVPLMEFSPNEAVKNNVFGTYNMACCAEKYNVIRFVQISTDKAVNPTNVMGASKRLCEMIIQAFSKQSKTQFVAVRFGNVLGSNGSVVPRFKQQIEKGGPVTVTHKDITRFFMTIPEAAQLVLQAGANANGGEIFVLDMGKPVRIYDMAEKMIKLSGFTPNVDIQIKITGLRPGEKLYEELLMSEEGIKKTAHSKIFIGKLIDITREELNEKLDKLKEVLYSPCEEVKKVVAQVVPTYQYHRED